MPHCDYKNLCTALGEPSEGPPASNHNHDSSRDVHHSASIHTKPEVHQGTEGTASLQPKLGLLRISWIGADGRAAKVAKHTSNSRNSRVQGLGLRVFSDSARDCDQAHASSSLSGSHDRLEIRDGGLHIPQDGKSMQRGTKHLVPTSATLLGLDGA